MDLVESFSKTQNDDSMLQSRDQNVSVTTTRKVSGNESPDMRTTRNYAFGQ